MSNTTGRAYLELHLAVFLFGFTAILGDLIQLPALVLVWWRVLITCGFTALWRPRIWAEIRALAPRLRWRLLGIGQLVMLHWLTFYGAIKLANASVALICLGTTAFQAALLEPLILKRRISPLELGLGLLIVPAMALIANTLPGEFSLGFWMGLASAFFSTLFSVFNKQLANEVEPQQITFVELGGGALSLSLGIGLFSLYQPLNIWPPNWSDWGYLLLLAILCTNVAYTLAVGSLRQLSAFAANLSINLEPVYGIALAWLLLGESEQLNSSFYLGGSIIIAAVFSYAFLRHRQTRAK